MIRFASGVVCGAAAVVGAAVYIAYQPPSKWMRR